jgi:hypothetical protein
MHGLEEQFMSKNRKGSIPQLANPPKAQHNYFLKSSRNSSFVNPACCMIERSVPFLMDHAVEL